MANTSPKFGALVVASLSGVVGIKYLVGGTLALIDDSVISAVTVADMLSLTLGAGVLLCLVTGALYEAIPWARHLAILSFLAIGGLSVPALMSFDPIIVTETIGMALCTLYLLVRSPFKRDGAADIDDSESGTRTGSTLR